MNSKNELPIAGLIVGFAVVVYFGAYFLAADYSDVGSNYPIYFLRYRVGSYSMQGLAGVFEPARWVDEKLIRHRQATVLDYRVGGEKLK